MSAINQMFVGLFGAVGSVVSGITSLVNKWYPLTTSPKGGSNLQGNSSISYVNGTLYTGSSSGYLAKSTNGINWQFDNTLKFSGLIVYGNGVYVRANGMTGTAGTLGWSNDNVNYTSVVLPNGFGFSGLGFNPTTGEFLLAGYGSNWQTNRYIWSSPDGMNWTQRYSITTSITSVDNLITNITPAGSSFFVRSMGNLAKTSSNHTVLTTLTGVTNGIKAIYVAPLSLYVAVVSTTSTTAPIVFTSLDSTTWTRQGTWNSSSFPIYDIVWTGTMLVASSAFGVLRSADAINWTSIRTVMGPNLISMCTFGNGAIVASDSYSTVVSYDNGASWGADITGRVSYNAPLPTSATGISLINGITYANSKYWLTGKLSNTAAQIWYSTDKKTWFAVNSVYPATNSVYSTGVVYAGSAATPYYLAAGATTAGVVSTSNDGVTWAASSVPTPGTGWNSAATDGTTTVVVGNAGLITTTVDGVTFASRTSGTTTTLTSVEYANGTFVALGANVAVYSTDAGATWKVGTLGSFTPLKVIHNGTQFVAVGAGTATVNTKVSADGVSWATGPIATWGTTSMNKITYNQSVGKYFAVAASGVIYSGTTLNALTTTTLTEFRNASAMYLAVNGNEYTLIRSGFSTGGPIATSIDAGTNWAYSSWSALSSPTNMIINTFAEYGTKLIISTSRNVVPAVLFDTSTSLFTPLNLNFGTASTQLSKFAKAGSSFYAISANGDLSKSDSSLTSWTNVSNYAVTPMSNIVSNTSGSIVAVALNRGNSVVPYLLVSTNSGGSFAFSGPTGYVPSSFDMFSNGTTLFANFANSGANGNWYSFSSTNGTSWTQAGSSTITPEYHGRLGDAVYGNGVWLTTSNGNLGTSGFRYYRSTNGTSWAGSVATLTGQTYSTTPSAIAFYNGAFYIATNQGFYTTVDGLSFAPLLSADMPVSLTNMVVTATDWYGLQNGDIYKYTPQ